MNRRRTWAERFWPKVDRRGPSDCWMWLGARTGLPNSSDSYGYLGRIPASRVGPEVPSKRAHVLSWELHNGRPVPTGMVIRHTCDVTHCVNPAHLLLGTQAENVRDRDSRGRGANRHGARNPNCRLTADQVEEIRRRYMQGERQNALALEFGIKQPQVSRIVLRQSWTAGL